MRRGPLVAQLEHMGLTKKQTRNLVAFFWLFHGRFPAGTDDSNWEAVTMKQLQLDDPPIPGSPDFEKKKFAELLALDFNKLSVKVPGLLSLFKKDNTTMLELWTHCFDNQREFTPSF